MVDRPFPAFSLHAWLRRNAPQLVSLVLIALIALELAHTARALWKGPTTNSELSAATPTMPDRRLGVEVQSIVARHLFGIAIVDLGAHAHDPAKAAPTSASLVLDGTIATENPQQGIAIIRADGNAKVYSVGAQIGGAYLRSVYLDHIILDRAGTLESLLLQRLLLGGRTGSASFAGAAVPQTPVYIDNLGRVVDKPPGQLDKILRAVGSLDPTTGKQRGVLIYPIANGTPLRDMGLYPGDLLTAVNGTPLEDPVHGKEALDAIQLSSPVNVTVERQGRKFDLVLQLPAE